MENVKTWSVLFTISMILVLFTGFFFTVEQAVAQTDKKIKNGDSLVVWCADSVTNLGGRTDLKSGESKTVWCTDKRDNCNPDADYCLVQGNAFNDARLFTCNAIGLTPDKPTMKLSDWWRIKCE